MRNVYLLLAIFLLIGACSSGAPEKDIKTVLIEGAVHSKEIQVKDAQEAEYILQNNLNFLTAIFEQSTDPYYGTERWCPECYQENTIGLLTHIRDGFYAVSKLVLNNKFVPGFCLAMSTKSNHLNTYYQIWYYCNERPNLVGRTLPVEKLNDLSELEEVCLT